MTYRYYENGFNGFLLYKYHKGFKAFAADNSFIKQTLDAAATFYMLDAKQLIYNLALHAQKSGDLLPGIEKISVGGVYSVRGFDRAGLSGDNGAYLRSDLTYRISVDRETTQNPYISIDYGYVEKDDSSIYGRIIGGGVGMRINSGDTTIDVFMHAPLKDNRFTEASEKFFGFNASIGF
jgi:hemolysin activation/secretion protein